MKTLQERLATMTPEELRHALRATAEGDRTHRYAEIQKVVDDRAEVHALFEELLPTLIKVLEEMEST